MDVVLKDALGILDELQAYKGAGQGIREVHMCSYDIKKHTEKCLISYNTVVLMHIFTQNK